MMHNLSANNETTCQFGQQLISQGLKVEDWQVFKIVESRHPQYITSVLMILRKYSLHLIISIVFAHKSELLRNNLEDRVNLYNSCFKLQMILLNINFQEVKRYHSEFELIGSMQFKMIMLLDQDKIGELDYNYLNCQVRICKINGQDIIQYSQGGHLIFIH